MPTSQTTLGLILQHLITHLIIHVIIIIIIIHITTIIKWRCILDQNFWYLSPLEWWYRIHQIDRGWHGIAYTEKQVSGFMLDHQITFWSKLLAQKFRLLSKLEIFRSDFRCPELLTDEHRCICCIKFWSKYVLQQSCYLFNSFCKTVFRKAVTLDF